MSDSPSITRRGLLRGCLAVGAAPLFIPASARGQAGRPAPSERLTVAMIGIGNMGSGHFGYWLGNRETQLLATCDCWENVRNGRRDETNRHYAAATASGTYKGCTAYRDFRDVMQRDDIDLVCIAVPDHWHALIVIEAAKAGKDIYSEKPMSLTLVEADAMVRAVQRHNVVFQLGSQQRSSHEFLFACEMVRSGRIGKIKNINVNVGGPSWPRSFPNQPTPPGLDLDMWLGPAPWSEYNEERMSGNYGGGWRQVRDYSGGGMTDWGNHHYDIAQWGLGRDLSGPVEIIPPNVSPNGKLTMRYDDGITTTHGGGGNGVLFEGEHGIVEVNRGHLRTDPPDLLKVPTQAGEVHLYESRDHHGNFLDCVRTRNKPICDVETGRSTITVCHLGNIAWWLGRTIRWDPVKREILGDPEATRWMDRPRREPWRLEV
ncbi:MAG: Gfo/Idh/MocA family oxidoreductase [Armatimonadetes bacterium]|nr:Gfo/Idh/MocA family oxidoreductase [Armatimonadota bacterium]